METALYNEISANKVSSNATGILVASSSKNDFLENQIGRNDRGIYLHPTALDNKFYHNNLIDNNFNAEDDGSNEWDDGYPSGGNYWSDYQGVDNYSGPRQDENGPDGIGDMPYDRIRGSGGGEDRYPLMVEYTAK